MLARGGNFDVCGVIIHMELAWGWGRSDRLCRRLLFAYIPSMICMMCCTWYVFVVAPRSRRPLPHNTEDSRPSFFLFSRSRTKVGKHTARDTRHIAHTLGTPHTAHTRHTAQVISGQLGKLLTSRHMYVHHHVRWSIYHSGIVWSISELMCGVMPTSV